MTRLRTLPLMLVIAGLLAAGCGGGESDSAAPAKAKKASPAPPPAALIGTYTTTLSKADIPTPTPPELRDQRRWIVRITKDGGVDNAPALTILMPPSEPLESSTLSVSGDTLTLSREECAPTDPSGKYTLVNSAYRYELDGDMLRLTTVKPGCPDKVAQTILTAGPLKRS